MMQNHHSYGLAVTIRHILLPYTFIVAQIIKNVNTFMLIGAGLIDILGRNTGVNSKVELVYCRDDWRKNSLISVAAVAPSPVAATTWRSIPERTSPAANKPAMVVS